MRYPCTVADFTTSPRLPCRRHRAPRCRLCGLHLPLCICLDTPRVNAGVRLVVVQHAVEMDRPTNTGRMAAHIWSPSLIVPYAVHGHRADESELVRPDHDYLLLYPRPGAVALTAAMLKPVPGRHRTLVVLDGSWRQAAHMARRWASLRLMPCVALPPGPAGAWDIRHPIHPHQLCTLEAVIRVVELLGERETARRLRETLAMMNQGMRFMRGLRPRPPTWEEVREARP